MLSETQRKLLEIIAPSGLAIASIFFAVLVFLYGAILSQPAASERRPLRHGIMVTYIFSLLSLLLAVVAMFALRFQTILLYQLTLWSTATTMTGMFLIATFILAKTLGK